MSVGHSPETHVHAHPELGFLRKYIFSEDHKIIGIQFLFSGLIFLFIGGALALLVRIQLRAADAQAITAEGVPQGGPRGWRLVPELGHEPGPMGAVSLVVEPVPDIPQVRRAMGVVDWA